ncbi:MAG: hypothetical protein OEY22_09790 [Candidatus Bathyarchaeota archaeon]|nr:hypothetical protein [Candidatus Bathyarchaeota archaeon]
MQFLSWLTRKPRVTIICICLVLLVLTPIFYWTMIRSEETHGLEPSEIYFFNFNDWFSNETFWEVWNKTKNLDVMAEFSRNGNYSVLVCPHGYGWRGEWFIVASTLEPSSEGLIHELVLRLDYENLTFIKSYEQSHSFNMTSVENGTRTIDDLMNQSPNHYVVWPREEDFFVNYPFLILFVTPMDFGITVILNLYTGKVMIAATGIWCDGGHVIYPENIYDVGF